MSNTIITHGVGAAWPCSCRSSYCPSCHGVDVPATGWGNTSFSLIVGHLINFLLHILVDFGSGCTRSIQRAGLRGPKVVFSTHIHMDHSDFKELDTLKEMARQDGYSEPIQFVATDYTFSQIPAFLRSHFAHVPAIPNQRVSMKIDGVTMSFLPIDASDHFTGAVMYVIEVANIKTGFLFDKKSWSTVPLSDLEDLDFAFLEANTIEPMNSKTGHVSLAEGLQMLRRLNKSPRASFVFHYGHDESRRMTLGNRILQLASLAPDLCAYWAYPGMTVSSEYLRPRNPVGVLDRQTRLVIDAEEKQAVHTNGILHAAVSILCTRGDGLILAYRRHPEQSHGGKWDALGGHMEPWENPLQTAIREAREELRLSLMGFKLQIETTWFQALSEPFDMPCPAPQNNELGTLFGLTIPEDVQVTIFDTLNDGREVQLQMRAFTLSELRNLWKTHSDTFADGLGRTIARIDTDAAMLDRIEKFIRSPLPI